MLDQLAERLGLTRSQVAAIVTAITAGIALLAAFGIGDDPSASTSPPAPPSVEIPLATGVTGTITPDPGITGATGPVDNQTPAGHEDLADETPPGVPRAKALEGLEQETAPGVGPPQPSGGAQNYTVRTAYVGNVSSRNGQKAQLLCLHYTVSANRPGWSDVNAIRNYFNVRSSGVSSHYIVDFEGHVLRIANESSKTWTQGNFNGRCISIEIIATGSETRAQWTAAPLFKRGILASLSRDIMRRNGLPLRWVDPRGCTVQRAGVTDHNSLECGNDHHDVTPNFPYQQFMHQLTIGAILTDRKIAKWCRSLKIVRAKIRARKSNASQRSRGRELKKLLQSRGAPCV